MDYFSFLCYFFLKMIYSHSDKTGILDILEINFFCSLSMVVRHLNNFFKIVSVACGFYSLVVISL